MLTPPAIVVIEWTNECTVVMVCVLLIVAGVAALLVRDRSRWD